ncbi:MAG: hypothetical protein ACRDOA_11240 [Streptosporangiaceae bacterium]
MTSTTPAARRTGPGPSRHPGARPVPVTSPPAPAAAARIMCVVRDHPSWSVFWDKAHAVWRAAEDDPDSDLYAESSDPGTVISYIQAHS